MKRKREKKRKRVSLLRYCTVQELPSLQISSPSQRIKSSVHLSRMSQLPTTNLSTLPQVQLKPIVTSTSEYSDNKPSPNTTHPSLLPTLKNGLDGTPPDLKIILLGDVKLTSPFFSFSSFLSFLTFPSFPFLPLRSFDSYLSSFSPPLLSIVYPSHCLTVSLTTLFHSLIP